MRGMRVLVWVSEETWEASVDAVRAFVPPEATLTLLYVASADVVEAPGGALGGLLGRRPPHRDPVRRMATASAELGQDLLAAARERLGRSAETEQRMGRPEREVVAAAAGADLLVVARDGERDRPGPRSLAPPTRFVVDHTPCAVLLVWPNRRG